MSYAKPVLLLDCLHFTYSATGQADTGRTMDRAGTWAEVTIDLPLNAWCEQDGHPRGYFRVVGLGVAVRKREADQ